MCSDQNLGYSLYIGDCTTQLNIGIWWNLIIQLQADWEPFRSAETLPFFTGKSTMYLIMDFEWKMNKDFASFTTLPETSSEFAPENTKTESQKRKWIIFQLWSFFQGRAVSFRELKYEFMWKC